MATLTEISVATRKYIIWLAVVFVGYLIIKSLIGFGIAYWKKTHPKPLPLPNVLFGKLPSPIFTNIATTSSGLKFTLESIEGRPPETTTAGKVYTMPKKLPTLLSSQRAKALAAKLGFTDEPIVSNMTFYHFTDPKDKLRTLDLDSTTMNFKLRYDYRKSPQIFTHGQQLGKDAVEKEVKDFIQSNSLFDASILNGVIMSDSLMYDPAAQVYFPAGNKSQIQVIRVNFFRGDLDGMKVLPPGFHQSYNYALYVPPLSFNWKILELYYTFWPIAFDDYATYPLRSSATAWQDLIDGYGVIVTMGKNSPDKIVIRNIYLAYYDSEEPQQYMQPIFVFEGDNDFIAYVPAIDSQWLE